MSDTPRNEKVAWISDCAAEARRMTAPNRPDVGEALRERLRTEVEAVIREMRERKVNHGKSTSPTLEAWAGRLEAAINCTSPAPGGDSVLVPREPTPPRIEALLDGCRDWFTAYAAMLAAAPAPAVGREAVGAIFKRGKMRHFSQATTPEEIERFHKDNPAGWEFDGWLYTAPTFNDHIEAIRAKLVAMAGNWRAGRYLDGTKTLWGAEAHASDGMEACADNVDELLSTAITTPPAEAREPVGDVEALRRELLDEATRHRGSNYADDLRNLLERAAAALAQPRDTPRDSGDAADAARYRFLRDPKNSIVYAMDWVNWNEVPHSGRSHFRYEEPEQLDSAIDAQLAAMQSPTGEPT